MMGGFARRLKWAKSAERVSVLALWERRTNGPASFRGRRYAAAPVCACHASLIMRQRLTMSQKINAVRSAS